MKLLKGFFSCSGRKGRTDYLMVIAVAYFISTALDIGLGGREDLLSLSLVLAVNLILAIKTLLSGIQRLHDMGRPGKRMWLMLIPLYNIYFGLLLIFKGGDQEDNIYGLAQKNKTL